LANAVSSTVSRSNPTPTTEKAILDYYTTVENHCAIKIAALQAEVDTGTKKEAHVNAWGGVLTLLGGVAVYPPVKAVLMGIGISSSGGSNSVLGGVAGSLATSVTTTKAQVDDLKANYDKSRGAYEAIATGTDSTVVSRYNALVHLMAICDGLDASSKP
jgi:hypothetical protein